MRRTALALLGVALAVPAPAGAHGGGSALADPLALLALTPDQAARLDFESKLIGREHALLHTLTERRSRRAQASENEPFDPCRPRGPAKSYDESRPLPPEGRPTGQTRCSKLPRQPRTRSGLRAQGRWSNAYLDLPHYAIHAALLPTGKVLFYGFEWTQRLITRQDDSHQGTSAEATIWDPAKGTGPAAFKPVPAPLIDVDGDGVAERVPLYCSGQSFLPDGRLLVTGGTLDLRWVGKGYTNPPGIPIALIFDPWREQWSRTQDMTVPRWYPTNVRLGDGRTLVLGGFDSGKPTNFTRELDVVSRDGRTITHAPSGDRQTFTYPGMLQLPSGKVLLGGPLPTDTGLLDPRTMTWAPLPQLPAARGGEAVVPVPSRRGSAPQAMLIGGTEFTRQGNGAEVPAYSSTLVFDDRDRAAGFVPGPSLRAPRNWPNTVLLPDGSMVTVGGGDRITDENLAYNAGPDNFRVELWNRRTRRWTLGAAQREARTYHSVALLLPDGRVWSAGDDASPNRDGDTAEIYEPPYLHHGRGRPRAVRAPRRLRHGKRFTVRARSERRLARVTLVAPSATTHALDMNQRFVELAVKRRRDGSLSVRAPRRAVDAPPGRWMLWVLDDRGVPSAAHWVRLG